MATSASTTNTKPRSCCIMMGARIALLRTMSERNNEVRHLDRQYLEERSKLFKCGYIKQNDAHWIELQQDEFERASGPPQKNEFESCLEEEAHRYKVQAGQKGARTGGAQVGERHGTYLECKRQRQIVRDTGCFFFFLLSSFLFLLSSFFLSFLLLSSFFFSF